MQEFPSIQDIYDLSSADLNLITAKINGILTGPNLDDKSKLHYEQYLESINIEIQERKTLQFFRDLCELDNPYLKKVTDFNNEFLKLAAQAIQLRQKNEGNSFEDLRYGKIDSIKEELTNVNDGVSVTSAADTQSIISKAGRTNFTENDRSTQKNQSHCTQKTMGIGKSIKKGKNQMKDFILSTLNKNKMDTYVVKSNNPDKKIKPIVDQRGHLIRQAASNGQIPLSSTKSIKSSDPKLKEKKMEEPVPKREVNQEVIRKQEQMINKTKGLAVKEKEQKSSVKGKKKNSDLNKMLVEMVKKEEEQKKEKQFNKLNPIKQIQSKQLTETPHQIDKKKNEIKIENPPLINQRSQPPRDPSANIQIVKVEQRKITATAIIKHQEYESEQIEEELQGNDGIDQTSKQRNQQIKEEIQITEEQHLNAELNSAIKNEQNASKQPISHHFQRESNDKGLKKQQNEDQKQQQSTRPSLKLIPSIQSAASDNLTIDNQQFNKNKVILDQQHCQDVKNDIKYASEEQLQLNYQAFDQMISNQRAQLLRMREDSELEENLAKNIYKPTQKMSANFGKIVQEEEYVKQKEELDELKEKSGESNHEIDSQREVTDQHQVKEENLKKCYNQQYWIHIREEAQLKIKRFKEEKELMQQAKANKLSMAMTEQQTQVSVGSQSPQKQQSNLQIQVEQDEFIQKRKEQLTKMIKQHNKKQQIKKVVPQIAVPKIIHPRPEFDYLQIYPSLNHIFSVMYTKPQNQALMDVPLIMKELTNMFSTHLQHFKDKGGSIFQPAIFLPFDHSNNLQLTDPRQLLLHAENTYVNLKTLVERLEVFNANLQGHFNTTSNRYYRVVKSKEEVYDIITTAFLRRKGWKELPHGCSLRASWNLFWSWSKPEIDLSKLLVWQRINHFPFNKNLSRKDLLYKNLDSFRKNLKVPFNFLPLTFNLPKQFTQFSIKFHQQQITNRDANYWIMKPIGKSRGRGIKVINSLAELNYTDNIVVQKYIANPLLLDGYKFDMRIYVLVTNFHPLQAFLYKEGFARLSTEKFSMEPMFIKNTFIHLTNFSIQKNNLDAKITFAGGSKISLKVLKDKINKMGYSFNSIWSQVTEIIVKSLLGCSISVPPFPTAFQLFGYDIMIDTDGACHLIEINASPSLQRSYLIDEIVKQSLIDDILDIVDPPDFDKEALLDVMSDRLNKNNSKKKFTAEDDLISIARILKYQKIRKVGEPPEKIGLFEMIAPSKMSTDIERLIKSKSGSNNPHNID